MGGADFKAGVYGQEKEILPQSREEREVFKPPRFHFFHLRGFAAL